MVADLDPRAREAAADVRREAAARVHRYRERGQSRPVTVRVLVSVAGGIVLLASLPLCVVLPEVGVPILLLGLRFLAVEADWAARACVWIDWRFTQAKRWFGRQRASVRAAVGGILVGLAALLVWLLVVELT